MIPIVFINCSSAPYIDKIMNGNKIYETRTRNTLKSLVGKTVLLCETGNGKSIVRCSARIVKAFPVTSYYEWNMFREYTCIPFRSPHEWTEKTKIKWLYEIDSVRPLVPFIPRPGFRHGRVWMESNETCIII